jgi:hypothetical protein
MKMRVGTLLVLALLPPNPAAAQPPADPEHRQSLGAGVQWALPNAGRTVKPGLQVSWRRWLSPRVGVGADARFGVLETTREIDFPESTGPGGIIVRSQQGRERVKVASQGYGFGLHARSLAGRMTVTAGVGPGLFVDRRTHDIRINDWFSDGTETQRSLGVQGTMEMEVRATSRVLVFAGLRMELRDVRDGESSSGYPAIGARVAF